MNPRIIVDNMFKVLILLAFKYGQNRFVYEIQV
jgi:hypothetical protein